MTLEQFEDIYQAMLSAHELGDMETYRTLYAIINGLECE